MKTSYLLIAAACCIALPVRAERGISAKQSEVMNQLLVTYAEKAKAEAKNPQGRGAFSAKPFSADVGREFFLQRRTWQSHDFTCSGCHTNDPTKEGKSIKSKQAIKPLAPSVNPERFIDAKRVEANFTEHCMDLHERDCTAYEKGNFITYLMSVK